MLSLITYLLLAAIAAVTAYVMFSHAKKWDSSPVILAAQKEERLNAREIVRVLSIYFDALDVNDTGILTRDSLKMLDFIDAPERDIDLIQDAILNAGGHSELIINPWLFGPWAEYRYEPVGHKTGSHKDERFTVAPYGPSAITYKVDVDDYGIDRVDLATYVARVEESQIYA